MPLIHLNVSQEQKAQFEAEAKSRGLNLSAFMRESAMLMSSKTHVVMDSGEWLKLMKENFDLRMAQMDASETSK